MSLSWFLTISLLLSALIRCSDLSNEFKTSSSPSKTETDFLTSCPALIYIASFLINPFILLPALNRRTRHTFKYRMPPKIFIDSRFNIPEVLELKGTEYDIHHLLNYQSFIVIDPVHFFCSLASDVFSNGVYDESKHVLFRYLLKRYSEFPVIIRNEIERLIKFQQSVTKLQATSTKKHSASFFVCPVEFITELIELKDSETELVLDSFKCIAHNSELLEIFGNFFFELGADVQSACLSFLIIAEAPYLFCFKRLKAKEFQDFSQIISSIFSVLMFKENGPDVYEAIEGFLTQYKTLPFINADDSKLIEIFHLQNQIFFGRIDNNFYETKIATIDFSCYFMNHIAMFASFRNRKDLIARLLKDRRLCTSIIPFPTTNPRSVYLYDRYVAQLFQLFNNGFAEDEFPRQIPSLLRNYVLDKISISYFSYQISLIAMEGRVADGFPELFDFNFDGNRFLCVGISRIGFMVRIASHVQKSNPTTFKYIINYLDYYYRALPDASCQFIFKEGSAFAEENLEILQFMIKHNIMIEVSESTLKQLKEYPESYLIYLIPILTVNPQNLVSMLLSAKSPAELRILESISSPIESEKRIDSLYFELFDEFDTDAEYYEVRHIFKYWLNGPYKESILKIDSDNIKNMILTEFPDKMHDLSHE